MNVAPYHPGREFVPSMYTSGQNEQGVGAPLIG
jgi:hypothetical protein